MRPLSICSLDDRVHRNCLSQFDRELRTILFAAVLLLFGTQVGFSQKSTKPVVVEDRTIVTDDQVSLKITYFKPTGGKESPVVVLLHGKSGNRQNWKGVATILQEGAEFAVVTVDLRGHGDSQLQKTKKIDYQAMSIRDMEAVKRFLYEEHQLSQLNMNKLGIVACDFSASVAMVYTEFDWNKEPFDDSADLDQRTPQGQDIQALVLISPDTSTPGLFAAKTATSLRGYPNLAVMVAASEKSGHDFQSSKKLFDQISFKKDKSEHVVLKKYPEDVRGMNLVLQDDDLKNDLSEFLIKYVKNHNSQWRDRQSRLER